MNHDAIRQELLALPAAKVPPHVSARLQVTASHARSKRLKQHRLFDKLSVEFSNLFKPFAVPAAGGLLSSVILFGALVNTLNIRQYLLQDVPIGVFTQVAVDDLSPFVGSTDVLVQVSVNEKGIVTDFSTPNGTLNKAQALQIGNLVLYSTFTPATADGRPVPGKILVAVHHINVRG